MITTELCRKRANRLLRRAARAGDPDQRVALEDEAKSWMSLARVARWEALFGAEDDRARLLH
jgi:hypothetical protein